jgi:predicted oxidoreductase
MTKQTLGKTGLEISRVALGCMGLAGTWNPADVGADNIKRAIETFEAALESGITFYDHADIYGATACESVFRECLGAVPGSREKIVIATKCGIRSGHYNLTKAHIEASIEGSLERMGVEFVDLYQMHRPDPLTHPRETAAGLRSVIERGLVRYVGVSNYYPEQVRALQTYLEEIPIVSNQIEISLMRLDPIYEGWMAAGALGDGTLDQCMALGMTPLAYSPLGRAVFSNARELPDDDPKKPGLEATRTKLATLAEKYQATPGQIALAWLLAHPAGIVPLVGSNNPEHVREAAQSAELTITREEWYGLWSAAWGRGVP